jgi:hypothetical protein
MTTLAEALTSEREKRRREAEDAATRREVGRAVLQAVAHRLNADPLTGWSFISRGDEIIVARSSGAGSRQHVATWIVDDEMRLVLDQEMTEWITAESCARVVDEAVRITARFILDEETRAQPLRRELSEYARHG